MQKTLTDRLKKIFDLDEATFDLPSESREQECIFVEIENNRSNLKDAEQVFRVSGTLRIFVQVDKMPYGYFQQKIQAADPALTRGFFFGSEENRGTFANIGERAMSFVFLFKEQYDPAIGEIEEIEFEESNFIEVQE